MSSIIASSPSENRVLVSEPALSLSMMVTAGLGTPAIYVAFTALEQDIVAPAVMTVFLFAVSSLSYRVFDRRFAASKTPQTNVQRHDVDDDQGAGGR